MIILRHNTLSADDLFTIETAMLKIAESPYEYTLEYSLLNKPSSEIYGYIGGIVQRMKVCQTLGITISEFLDFLIDVEKGYNGNPYHSFYHAVDITMVLYHMLELHNMSEYLTPVDLALLLIAALCHDIGHPGKNNQFEVCCKTELAKQFKNLSVLESQSCVMTLDLLDKHDLIRNLNSIDEMKSLVVRMILATDMVCHSTLQENISTLHRIVQNQHPDRPELKALWEKETPYSYFEQTYFKSIIETLQEEAEESVLNRKERLMLCKILIHAADISNPCRPWTVFYELSNLVCIEFFKQGEEESKLGFNVSPNMDSKKSNSIMINIGFIDGIVQPYFETLCQLFPKCKSFTDECTRNRGELTIKTKTVIKDGKQQQEQQVTITANNNKKKEIPPTPMNRNNASITEHLTRRRNSEDIGTILRKHRKTQRSSIPSNRHNRRKSDIYLNHLKMISFSNYE